MTVTCHALVAVPPAGESVRPDTVFYYRSMRVAELEETIGLILTETTRRLGRIDADLRDRLLPALMVLRKKVPRGEWQRFLRAHSLNPATVRQWRARQKAATGMLLGLLGEPPRRKRPPQMPTPESVAEALLKAAKRICEEILKGNLKYAHKLAAEFLEAYASA